MRMLLPLGLFLFTPLVLASFRLPRDVFPSLYTIRIITDLEAFTFNGEVTIEVDCKNNTDSVTLHSNELEIMEDKTKVLGKENIIIAAQKHNPDNDFYVLKLSQPMEAGEKYVLHLQFRGNLTEGLAGYYRSHYKDRATEQTRWIAVTQFEATYARKAFPCFDEPDLKAQFKVILGRRQEYRSCSNMPLEKSEPIENNPGWIWDHFQMTEYMSTYLVAYMVSDFVFRVSPPIPGANNVTFRIWSRPDALNQTEFAGEVGPKVLQYFEEYFDIKFPLPKQDMVAIPDFSPGAMENWGLITYRETALLFDPKVSSSQNKMNIASTIAHELAHQWFGNLVTMKWFSDLWLNEGFATYVSTLGVHKLYPEWNVPNQDSVDGLLQVFELDALKTSHPVSVAISSPSKIGQIFDPISYKKGAYLLRMMNLFLGEKVFQQGVRNYLKKHKFGNAEQDDLWDCLTKMAHRTRMLPSHITIKMIMDKWTLQTGYPVINVVRDYDKGTANITQRRYLSCNSSEDKPSCWIIPLSYTTQSEADFSVTQPKLWMTCDKEVIEVTQLPNNQQWVIFNINVAGLFRVNYDEQNWKLITDALIRDQYTKIGILNRVQILEDAFKLAYTGDLPYSTVLGLIKYLEYETEYLPWQAAGTNLNKIYSLVRRTLGHEPFRNFVRKLITPNFETIGDISRTREITDVQKMKQHTLITSWASRMNIGNALDQVLELFKRWMMVKNPDIENPVPRDLRNVVYCSALRHGGEKEWNFAWQRYINCNVGTEKISLLTTLGCTRESWILKRFLEWSLIEESGIRKQDSWILFTGVAKNEEGFLIAKEFFFKRLPDLYAYYGPKANEISKYLKVLAKQMYKKEEYEELKDFLKENEQYLKPSMLSVTQALETVYANIQWHKNHYENFITLALNY